MHNEELHNFYSSPNKIRIIKEDEIGRACSTNGEKKNASSVLVVTPEEKRPLG
jgi:hypothetical protein